MGLIENEQGHPRFTCDDCGEIFQFGHQCVGERQRIVEKIPMVTSDGVVVKQRAQHLIYPELWISRAHDEIVAIIAKKAERETDSYFDWTIEGILTDPIFEGKKWQIQSQTIHLVNSIFKVRMVFKPNEGGQVECRTKKESL